jgi:hypothetical protein
MAKDKEPENPNAAPKGVSDEDWADAQRQAAQQGMRPEDIIAKGKDPMHGLNVTDESAQEKK